MSIRPTLEIRFFEPYLLVVSRLIFLTIQNVVKTRCPPRPDLVANITWELFWAHRNPMDVAYALRIIYSGIYSSATRIRFLEQIRFTDLQNLNSLLITLFMVHIQEEKRILANQDYEGCEGSRILTIHEAQGLTWKSVIAIKTTWKKRLHGSVSHAVVAISRHTESFDYYADDDGIHHPFPAADLFRIQIENDCHESQRVSSCGALSNYCKRSTWLVCECAPL